MTAVETGQAIVINECVPAISPAPHWPVLPLSVDSYFSDNIDKQ